MRRTIRVCAVMLAIFSCGAFFPIRATPNDRLVPLEVSGIVCANEKPIFEVSPKRMPTIFVWRDGVLQEHAILHQVKKPGVDIVLEARLPAGNYAITLGSDFGIATIATALLPGHPRHAVVSICNIAGFYDSDRTLDGTLPALGLSGLLYSSTGVEPISVDGTAYYVSHVSGGPLEIRIYFSQGHLRHCDFKIPIVPPGTTHIKFDISADMLRGATGAKCDNS